MPTTPAPETSSFAANSSDNEGSNSVTDPRTKTESIANIPSASDRRLSLIEQFIRNRPGSAGAKLLCVMDRVRALFVDPRTRSPKNSPVTVQRGMSVYNLLEAIMGRRPEDVVVDRIQQREDRNERRAV